MYRDMLKGEEARREDGDVDIEVHPKSFINFFPCSSWF